MHETKTEAAVSSSPWFGGRSPFAIDSKKFGMWLFIVSDTLTFSALLLAYTYLRLATALAGILGSILLTIQYFILLPPFAWLAKRAERRELSGWTLVSPESGGSLDKQY